MCPSVSVLLLVLCLVAAPAQAMVSMRANASSSTTRLDDTCLFTVNGTSIAVDLSSLFATYNSSLGYDKLVNGYGSSTSLFRFNLCNPISLSWSSSSNPSCVTNATYVCQYTPPLTSTSNNIAVAFVQPTTVQLVSNGFNMIYDQGSSQHCSGTRSATFQMRCAATETYPFALAENPTCWYNFEWDTPLACAENYYSTSCSLSTGDGLFDLSPLAGNVYAVNNGVYPNVIDYLVLCDDTDYVRQCSPGSAVCEYTGSAYNTIGTFPTMLREVSPSDNLGQNVTLVMTYSRPTAGTGVQVEIQFICDVSAGIGAPEFASDTTTDLTLVWPSLYACPQWTPTPTASATASGTRSSTKSATKSATRSNTMSITASYSASNTMSATESATESATGTATASATETATESATGTATQSATATATQSATATATPTPSQAPLEPADLIPVIVLSSVLSSVVLLVVLTIAAVIFYFMCFKKHKHANPQLEQKVDLIESGTAVYAPAGPTQQQPALQDSSKGIFV